MIEKCKDCKFRYSCLSNSDVEKVGENSSVIQFKFPLITNKKEIKLGLRLFELCLIKIKKHERV